MQKLVKAGLLACASSFSLCALTSGSAKAEIAGTNSSSPAAQQLIAQAPIVDQAVAYKQGTGFYATLGLGAQWPQRWSYDTTFNENVVGINNFDGDIGLGGGFSGDIGVGYDFGAIRAELTYGYTNSSARNINVEIDTGNNFSVDVDGSVNKSDVLVSAYWDMNTKSRWTPYIGGGIGWTNIGTPGIGIDRDGFGSSDGQNRSAFGYQAKLGVSYGASESTDVFVEGVYQGAAGLADVEEVDFGSFNSWGAKIGVRFRFGGAQTATVEEVQSESAPEPTPAPMQPEPATAPIRGLW